MKNVLIVGIVLILIGVAGLTYDHFNYTTTENILQIGSLTATAEREHTVWFPPIFGWLLVGGGVCAVAFAAFSRKK